MTAKQALIPQPPPMCNHDIGIRTRVAISQRGINVFLNILPPDAKNENEKTKTPTISWWLTDLQTGLNVRKIAKYLLVWIAAWMEVTRVIF